LLTRLLAACFCLLNFFSFQYRKTEQNKPLTFGVEIFVPRSIGLHAHVCSSPALHDALSRCWGRCGCGVRHRHGLDVGFDARQREPDAP